MLTFHCFLSFLVSLLLFLFFSLSVNLTLLSPAEVHRTLPLGLCQKGSCFKPQSLVFLSHSFLIFLILSHLLILTYPVAFYQSFLSAKLSSLFPNQATATARYGQQLRCQSSTQTIAWSFCSSWVSDAYHPHYKVGVSVPCMMRLKVWTAICKFCL